LRGERGEQTDDIPCGRHERVVRKRALILTLSRERDEEEGEYICVSRGDANRSPPHKRAQHEGGRDTDRASALGRMWERIQKISQ